MFLISGLKASLPVEHGFRVFRQQRGSVGGNPVSAIIGVMRTVCITYTSLNSPEGVYLLYTQQLI